MSVAINLAIPDQPADGQVRIQPLGGNGYSAPHSEYIVVCKSTGDVSGGTNSVHIRPDPQYVSLVLWAAWGMDTVSADQAYRMSLTDVRGAQLSIFRTATYGASGLGSGTSRIGAMWSPPPVLLSADAGSAGDDPQIEVWVPNTSTAELSLNCRILNFAKNARETTPLPVLLSSVPRAAVVA